MARCRPDFAAARCCFQRNRSRDLRGYPFEWGDVFRLDRRTDLYHRGLRAAHRNSDANRGLGSNLRLPRTRLYSVAEQKSGHARRHIPLHRSGCDFASSGLAWSGPIFAGRSTFWPPRNHHSRWTAPSAVTMEIGNVDLRGALHLKSAHRTAVPLNSGDPFNLFTGIENDSLRGA